jgi:Tol biopolymer transport system component
LPVRGSDFGDWKVATTGRQECLPYNRSRDLRLAVLSLAVVWSLFATPSLSAASGEADFLNEIRQLTFEGKRSGEGYFSPDGKALIFQSEREPDNPFYQIYLLDFETGETHRVSPGIGKTTCSFFRPGTDEVLFSSSHHDPEARAKMRAEIEFRSSGQQRRYSWDYDEAMEIWSAHRDGSQLSRLTDAKGYDAEASYSPDGKLIVFSSNRHAYTDKLSPEDQKRLEVDRSYFCELYLMNADGSNVRRLTFTPGYDGGPFFSPDGQRIIWRRFETNGVIANVFTMKLDGSDVRQVTDFGCMSWAPYFHPSGEYIILTANKLGFDNFELFLVDSAGLRQPVRVTFTDGFDGLPVFSPDGQKLCWTTARTADHKSQLFLAGWNHNAALKAISSSPLRQPQGRDSLTKAASPGSVSSSASSVPSSASSDINASNLKADVEFLASDALEGRRTGEPGAQKAAAFIIEKFQHAGLKPFGAGGDFRQPFEFTAGVKTLTNQNQLSIKISGQQPVSFEPEKDFRPLSLTANDTFEGEVVFAGYGLSVPEGAEHGYNSYDGLDVSNKVALVLRYVPEDVPPKRRQELNMYAGLRYKAMMARQRGAKALLVVTGPNSPNAGQLVPLTFDSSLSGSGIIAASISDKMADAILAPAARDLKTLQTALDTENPHAGNGTNAAGFLIPKVIVQISAGVQQIKKMDNNIIAMLPAGADSTSSEYLLVGAHYDHLGRGDANSLEHADEAGQIHHGADDNASGTAVVLELARTLASEQASQHDKLKRGIIFALWSGEELGVIGSSHFSEEPPVNLSNIVAYVNFDMVGRLTENKLDLQGVGSSSAWRKLIEKRNVASGFNVVLQDDPYLPTDVTAFYPKGVPVLHFFTGSHEDYHRPTDTADKINYPGMERIAKFAHGLIADLLVAGERPDYLRVTHSDSGSGSREQLRVYLGTIPDYTAEVEGVKLSGVRAGGPAEKAGVKGGDIIVEFGGQQIKNIYDYTYALDAVKVGKPVELVVLRDGQRAKLVVTPEARKP